MSPGVVFSILAVLSLNQNFGGGRGGGGKGGSSGSKGSKGSSGKPAPAVGNRGSTVPVSGTTFGSGKTTSTAYGPGGVKVTTIPQGQPFAGRTYGGATRGEIYGTGVTGSGVAGRNFPYISPPVIWVDYGYGPPYSSHEYGEPRSTNRMGGPEMQATFSSASLNSTFHVVADNSTVVSLIGSIRVSCSGKFSDSAIQYYRASSVVLTLDGYNNTAVLTSDANARPVALPSYVDTQLLGCLNSTIGEAVPLFSSAPRALPRPELGGMLSLSIVVVVVCHMLF